MTLSMLTSQQSGLCSMTRPCAAVPWRHGMCQMRQIAHKQSFGRARRKSCERMSVKAIGFDLGGSSGSSTRFDQRAAKLLRESRRVLVYHSVLKTKPAEAFLALLKSLQQTNKDNIVSDYSKFYHEIARTSSPHWRDFLLDEIITGRDNAWAREVSHGDTKSKKLQAAANDLQVLQALALENEDIVGLVREALPEVPDVWVRAGLNAGGSSDAIMGMNLLDAVSPTQLVLREDGDDKVIKAPLRRAEREELKVLIHSLDDWSGATSILSRHYHNHGFGVSGQASILQWKGGALSSYPDWDYGYRIPFEEDSISDVVPAWKLPKWKSYWPSDLSHISNDNLSFGPEELLPILSCYGVMGLRIVFMSLQGAKDRHSLLEEVLMLFRALRGHPRMRFLVMCRPPQEPNKEHLTSSTMQNFADDLKDLVPSNVALRFSRF